MLLPLLRGANAAANQCQANDVMESVTSHRMTTTVCIGLAGRRIVRRVYIAKKFTYYRSISTAALSLTA